MLDSTRVSALSFPRHYESTANLRHKSVKGWEIIITCNAHPPQITLSCELYIFYIYINLQSGYFTSSQNFSMLAIATTTIAAIIL